MKTKIWHKKSQEEIKEIVFDALGKNINYQTNFALGIPASYLDEKVFNQDASFVKDAPFISTLIKNPNHIGCHTLNESEHFFKGTQAIEKEVIDICAIDILKGKENDYDGYVASGGTEANIQAIWIYRNYFKQEFNASNQEIVILCSTDSHYSMNKASNLLQIDLQKIEVKDDSRLINKETLNQEVINLKNKGKKYFIVINNMMTTMFGSVDDIHVYVEVLQANQCEYKIHIDGAYGGFYYPFSCDESVLNFENPHITSFTLDAHKMAQAPYGTGLFIILKNYMQYTNTAEASYVEGADFTLIGSRSGANAVAVWMILVKNGPYAWKEKIFILQKRTDWMQNQLMELGISFYRHPKANIITLKASEIKKETALKYGLVPDNHNNPNWYKIVIMEHVTIEKLMVLLEEIKEFSLI